jgi:hypothetical protein
MVEYTYFSKNCLGHFQYTGDYQYTCINYIEQKFKNVIILANREYMTFICYYEDCDIFIDDKQTCKTIWKNENGLVVAITCETETNEKILFVRDTIIKNVFELVYQCLYSYLEFNFDTEYEKNQFELFRAKFPTLIIYRYDYFSQYDFLFENNEIVLK